MFAADPMDTNTLIFESLKLLAGILTLTIGGVISYQVAKIKVTQNSLVEGQGKAAELVATVAEKQVESTQAVIEVKSTLEQTTQAQSAQLDAIAKTSEATHALANGAMTGQLELSAKLAHRVADMSHDKNDLVIAVAAEKLYLEHKAANEV